MDKENTVTLKTDVDFEIADMFRAKEKDFIALIPKQDFYLFRCREITAEESIEIFAIADKSEFEAAQSAFEKVLLEKEVRKD